jgi:hypothetical protein
MTQILGRGGTSHNVYFAHLAFAPSLSLDTVDWIPDPPTLGSDLLVESRQLIAAIYSSVREHYWVVLHDALGVVRIRDVARKLVELGAADGAHRCGSRRGVG